MGAMPKMRVAIIDPWQVYRQHNFDQMYLLSCLKCICSFLKINLM